MAEKKFVVTPWEVSGVVDYERLIREFGTQPISGGLAKRLESTKLGKKPSDFDLHEINEAFSVAAIALMRVLDLDPKKVNVNGGAVAIGHPIGASGARILGALVHELRRRGGGYGCAAICSGGGQGDAVILKV